MSFCYKVISITWLSRAHTPEYYYRFYIFLFLVYEVSCLVTLKSRLGREAVMSRLGLEAMMSRLGLGRFGPRSSSDPDSSKTPYKTISVKLLSKNVVPLTIGFIVQNDLICEMILMQNDLMMI